MGEPTDDDASGSGHSGDTTMTAGGETRSVAAQPAQPVSDGPIAFGGYKLLEKIGEGGMGDVWLAQQVEPVRRKVALKIVKPGMDSRAIVGRFEAEHQALAMMNHPNVAKVYDAGQTPRGRPYFAMEFVRGEPITAYCDRHRLSMAARLALMLEVCDGVQHAHQKGLIHRDLKPSNILVTLEDGDTPRPKIIDFGIAKAMGQSLTEHTVHTGLGRLIGTPEYMSPEQAEMTGLDIDTRSDVYSLGIVLYELITGAQPYAKGELRSLGPTQLQRKIRDEEPPRPSARFASLDEDTATIAARHATSPEVLLRRLSGDLDWITMKALEKDRTRRYASPAELAADLRRHLQDEPVVARPPSAVYRALKFTRRHTLGVAAGAVAVLAVVAGIVGITVGLLRAQDAEMRALAARDEALFERDRARQAREETEKVVGFLTGLFDAADPGQTQGADLSARDVLDRGARQIELGFADQPEIRARLLLSLGEIYTSLGELDRAREQMSEALAIRRREHGDRHPDTIAALLDLAELEQLAGDTVRHERLAREALELARAVHGDAHVQVVLAMSALSLARDRLGDLDEAKRLQSQALAMARSLPDIAPVELERQVRRLAFLIWDRPQEAEALYLESLALCRESYGEIHPQTAFALDNIALFYRDQDDFDKAEPLFREALAMLISIYGYEHYEVAQTMGNVAGFLAQRMFEKDEFDEAIYNEASSMLVTSIETQRRLRGEHSYLGNNLLDLAELRIFAGRHEEVETLIEEADAVYATSFPADHPMRAVGRSMLGESYVAQQRYADAERLLLSARADLVGERQYEDDLAQTLRDLITTYDALNQPAVAERYREELATLYATEPNS